MLVEHTKEEQSCPQVMSLQQFDGLSVEGPDIEHISLTSNEIAHTICEQYHKNLDKLKYEIEKTKEENGVLRQKVTELEQELLNVRTRNHKLCELLAIGEIKEKADLLIEVDRLLKMRDELSSEVSNLQELLAQERSKGRALMTDREPKSQQEILCAQHCLNALLQGPYFTAVDLATIAQRMYYEERIRMCESGVDSEEYRRFLQLPSGNNDDSGYFSVQVISSALEVWGLELVPYNGTDERALEAQRCAGEMNAFICNYRDHWFTIRRLGQQWFNLNSLLSGPELISDTYLAVFLAQLQQEGYSIFVVFGNLPESEADNLLPLAPAVQHEQSRLLTTVERKVVPVSSQDSEEDPDLQRAERWFPVVHSEESTMSIEEDIPLVEIEPPSITLEDYHRGRREYRNMMRSQRRRIVKVRKNMTCDDNPQHTNHSLSCIICLEELEPLMAARLACGHGHTMHFKCLARWSKIHSICPICRAYF